MTEPMERPEVERLTRGVTVQRAEPVSHRCLCVLLYIPMATNTPAGERTIRDECSGTSHIPDSPLCQACIDARHDLQAHVPYTEVQASRRPTPS